MGDQRLGSYTFEWDPDEMTMPYSEKVVAEVETYGGTEIFEWTPSIVGKEVTLTWKLMSIGMWNALRRRYLVTGTTYVWDPAIVGGTTYNVVIKKLEGSYIKQLLETKGYREGVSMVLSIRSKSNIGETTTTTSTTTT